MNVSVEFGGRRILVPANGNTRLSAFLELVCTQFHLEPLEYTLELNKKPVDLGLTFRLAGVSQGSKFVLCQAKKRSIATVCLQMDNERLVHKFPVSCSLIDVLKHFNVLYAVDLMYMNHKSIGLSDNGVLRVARAAGGSQVKGNVSSGDALQSQAHMPASAARGKSADNSNGEAKVQVSQRSPAHVLPSETSKSGHSNSTHASQAKSSSSGDTQALQSESTQQSPPQSGIDRNIHYYLPPANSGPTKSTSTDPVELPDSFYELSTHDISRLANSLKGQTNALNEKPLMTQKMRDAEENAKVNKYPKTLIRVRFPDRTTLEATFISTEKRISFDYLFDVVRQVCRLPFRLYITPPMQNLDPGVTFYRAGLTPASLVYFASDTTPSGPWLSDVSLEPYPGQQEGNTRSEQEQAAFSGSSMPGHTLNEQATQNSLPSPSMGGKQEQSSSSSLSKKLPKWLKFNK